MISRVRGEVLEAEAGRVEVLLPGGVAYEVLVPLTVFERLPGEGAPVDLKTVLIVREDDHSLFGFLRDHERALFNRLRTTPKVGAKLALAMMSTYSAGRLAQILAERDVKALTRVSGVGKKTADLTIVHLADKVQDLIEADARSGPQASRERDAVSALVGLGYSPAEAESAVRAVAGPGGPRTTEEVIREVLAARGGRHDGPRGGSGHD